MKIHSNVPFIYTALLLLMSILFYTCKNDGKQPGAKDVTAEAMSKYDGIYVYTIERDQLNQRFLLHVSYPVTHNKVIDTAVEELSHQFIDEYERVVAEITSQYENSDGSIDEKKMPPTIHAQFIQHFDVAFANEKYFAFVFERYRNTGNTGSDLVFTKIYIRDSGKEVVLSDLFTTQDYLNRLSGLSREILLKRMEKEISHIKDSVVLKQQRQMRKDMIYSGTEPVTENFDSYRFTEEGTFQIIFDKYQVAAGYQGVIKIEIPIDKIADILQLEIFQILRIEVPVEKKELKQLKRKK